MPGSSTTTASHHGPVRVTASAHQATASGSAPPRRTCLDLGATKLDCPRHARSPDALPRESASAHQAPPARYAPPPHTSPRFGGNWPDCSPLSARLRTRDHHASPSPVCIAPVNSCPHVWRAHQTSSPRRGCSALAGPWLATFRVLSVHTCSRHGDFGRQQTSSRCMTAARRST
jgi:hypothetical protein